MKYPARSALLSALCRLLPQQALTTQRPTRAQKPSPPNNRSRVYGISWSLSSNPIAWELSAGQAQAAARNRKASTFPGMPSSWYSGMTLRDACWRQVFPRDSKRLCASILQRTRTELRRLLNRTPNSVFNPYGNSDLNALAGDLDLIFEKIVSDTIGR